MAIMHDSTKIWIIWNEYVHMLKYNISHFKFWPRVNKLNDIYKFIICICHSSLSDFFVHFSVCMWYYFLFGKKHARQKKIRYTNYICTVRSLERNTRNSGKKSFTTFFILDFSFCLSLLLNSTIITEYVFSPIGNTYI